MNNSARAEYCRKQIRACNDMIRKYPNLRDHYSGIKRFYAAELIKAEGVANDR